MSYMIASLSDEIQYLWSNFRYDRSDAGRISFLVNGSPKTGTTWMYRMLSSLPGFTGAGNLQRELDKFRKVEVGSVIHGHEPYSVELDQILEERKVRVIFMIRDPRDQVVSHMFHVRRDTTHPWHERMRSISNEEALMHCINGGRNLLGVAEVTEFNRGWLQEERSKALVKYETLHAHSEAVLTDVLRQCDIHAPSDLIRLIVERNRFERLSRGKKFWQTGRKRGQTDENSHFRKGMVGDWRNHFTSEHKARFKNLAGDTLIDLGYEKDLVW